MRTTMLTTAMIDKAIQLDQPRCDAYLRACGVPFGLADLARDYEAELYRRGAPADVAGRLAAAAQVTARVSCALVNIAHAAWAVAQQVTAVDAHGTGSVGHAEAGRNSDYDLLVITLDHEELTGLTTTPDLPITGTVERRRREDLAASDAMQRFNGACSEPWRAVDPRDDPDLALVGAHEFDTRLNFPYENGYVRHLTNMRTSALPLRATPQRTGVLEQRCVTLEPGECGDDRLRVVGWRREQMGQTGQRSGHPEHGVLSEVWQAIQWYTRIAPPVRPYWLAPLVVPIQASTLVSLTDAVEKIARLRNDPAAKRAADPPAKFVDRALNGIIGRLEQNEPARVQPYLTRSAANAIRLRARLPRA